jgi:hypothetical protein
MLIMAQDNDKVTEIFYLFPNMSPGGSLFSTLIQIFF